MNLRRYKNLLRIILSIVIIAGLIGYIWHTRHDALASFDAPFDKILLLAFLILLTWVLNCLPMMIFMRLMHRKIGLVESLVALVGSMLGNYLPMRVGTIIRMRFFKKKFDLDYMEFLGIMGVRTLLLFLMTSILGVIGITGLYLSGQKVHIAITGLFMVMTVFSVGLLFFPLHAIKNRKGSLGRLLDQLSAGHHILQTNLRIFWILALILSAQFIVLGLRLYLSFQAFGKELSVWAFLLIGPLGTLVSFVNLTPGNLGLREWIFGGLAGATGLDFQSGIFAGTLDRSVLMLLTFMIGPACLHYMWRKS